MQQRAVLQQQAGQAARCAASGAPPAPHRCCPAPLLSVVLLQDAKKGTLFDEFPPVLQLHLMRFSYDYMKDMMTKVGGAYMLEP